MGLDMRPMGKPIQGSEDRFHQIFRIVQGVEQQPSLGFFDKLKGKKLPAREELLQEWFGIQIPAYETIKAPRVGRDEEADAWIKEKYQETNKEISEAEFVEQHKGYYVIELAKETDGVPVYIAFGQDENVFRGQFLQSCIDLIGEELVNEAWETKLADETLAYGHRLMSVADKIAAEKNLQYLKEQRTSPETEEGSIEFRLHIVFSLAKWLIFYGKNGHGYEADF